MQSTQWVKIRWRYGIFFTLLSLLSLCPQAYCICLLYACTILKQGYWIPESEFFAGDYLIARRSRGGLHIVLLMIMIYCTVMTRHKPAEFISLSTMLTYYIQKQQRTNSNQTNFHAICVLFSELQFSFTLLTNLKLAQEGQETLANHFYAPAMSYANKIYQFGPTPQNKFSSKLTIVPTNRPLRLL